MPQKNFTKELVLSDFGVSIFLACAALGDVRVHFWEIARARDQVDATKRSTFGANKMLVTSFGMHFWLKLYAERNGRCLKPCGINLLCGQDLPQVQQYHQR